MAGRKLAVYTTIGGVTYAPGDVPPADVAKEITNPACWGNDAATADTGTAPAPAGPPPKGGAGSGQDAWLAYARTFDDVNVADDATREEIQAALTEAGHPVDQPAS